MRTTGFFFSTDCFPKSQSVSELRYSKIEKERLDKVIPIEERTLRGSRTDQWALSDLLDLFLYKMEWQRQYSSIELLRVYNDYRKYYYSVLPPKPRHLPDLNQETLTRYLHILSSYIQHKNINDDLVYEKNGFRHLELTKQHKNIIQKINTGKPFILSQKNEHKKVIIQELQVAGYIDSNNKGQLIYKGYPY